MPAFIWKTNPRMWNVVPPFGDSRGVLKAYITHVSAYVYWSTPRFQNEIAVGDGAYIWRTADGDRTEGIVARGRIEEVPRQLTPANASLFALPDRLTPPGWDEVVAPSSWKTGIRIEREFWDVPINAGMFPPQGTIGQLGEEDVRAIERVIVGR